MNTTSTRPGSVASQASSVHNLVPVSLQTGSVNDDGISVSISTLQQQLNDMLSLSSKEEDLSTSAQHFKIVKLMVRTLETFLRLMKRIDNTSARKEINDKTQEKLLQLELSHQLSRAQESGSGTAVMEKMFQQASGAWLQQMKSMQQQFDRLQHRYRQVESEVQELQSSLHGVHKLNREKVISLKDQFSRERFYYEDTIQDLKRQIDKVTSIAEQRHLAQEQQTGSLRNFVEAQIQSQVQLHTQHQNATSNHLLLHQQLYSHLMTDLDPWKREVTNKIDQIFVRHKELEEKLLKDVQALQQKQSTFESCVEQRFKTIEDRLAEQGKHVNQQFSSISQKLDRLQSEESMKWIELNQNLVSVKSDCSSALERISSRDQVWRQTWSEQQAQVHQKTADTLSSIQETLRILSPKTI